MITDQDRLNNLDAAEEGLSAAELERNALIEPRPTIVPLVKSPDTMMANIMDLAQITSEDVVVDLGCGDGRVVLAAAERGARGAGFDVSPKLLSLCRRNAAGHPQRSRVVFLERDFRLIACDPIFLEASVIYTYLLPEGPPLP